MSRLVCGTTVAALLLFASVALADKFTYTDEAGETVEIEARLAGSGQGVHALELADGQIRLVPEAAVKKRELSDGPQPIDDKTMIDRLTDEFGPEKFRAHRQKPYVIGLILAAPLAKAHEARAAGFLKNTARFMTNVERVFLSFAREVRFPTEPPVFPLVVLIFESDEDFNKYADEATGGRGLSAGNVAGFYSGLTNRLAIRLNECHTFETPLHEAVHQQVYNRHIFQRLAPLPAWFNEGIATGFEGNAERINVGPTKISTRYARLAKRAGQVDWIDVVGEDSAFRGDVLAGEAYAHAWSLHWLLVTEYKVKYMQYVQHLAQKSPLEESTAEDRLKEFESVFGKRVSDLQKEFRQSLDTGIKRQRVDLEPKRTVGLAMEQADLAEYGISAARRLDLGGVLEIEGKLKNLSPIRPMSFHVTVETDSGTYGEWLIPDLAVNQTAPLPKQFAQKLMRNARGGPSQTFLVRVKSAIPDSEEGQRWKNGDLPVPVYRR